MIKGMTVVLFRHPEPRLFSLSSRAQSPFFTCHLERSREIFGYDKKARSSVHAFSPNVILTLNEVKWKDPSDERGDSAHRQQRDVEAPVPK